MGLEKLMRETIAFIPIEILPQMGKISMGIDFGCFCQNLKVFNTTHLAILPFQAKIQTDIIKKGDRTKPYSHPFYIYWIVGNEPY